MNYVRDLTAFQAAMMLAGVVLFFISAFVLWGWRWGRRLEEGNRPRFSFPGIGAVSEPTRLLAGLFGMMVAYHLMVWAFPPSLTYMQIERSYWWAVVLGGAAAVAGSLLLDRVERRDGGSRASGPGNSPDGR
jgi:hypothetical protein